MGKVIGPSFRVAGIEPAEVRKAPRDIRLKFWTAALAFVLEAKDRELRRGLDRYGRPMAPLAESTIRNRHSEMGPADPGAPPLQPAHGLSRTRSLLTGQATPSGVVCWWEFDGHTQASWGEILKLHRDGAGHLPVRDVIGLSAVSKAEVAQKAGDWWRKHAAGLEGAPQYEREVYPEGGRPPFLVDRQKAPRPRRGVSELKVNGHHYTFQSGSAAQVREMVANKTFSGFRSGAEVKAELKALGVARKASGRVDWADYFNRRGPSGSPPRSPGSPGAGRPPSGPSRGGGGGGGPRRPAPQPAGPRFAAAVVERPDYSRKPPRPKPAPTPPAEPADVPAFPASRAKVVMGGWGKAGAKTTRKAVAEILGKTTGDERIASLVGAPDDATVKVTGSAGSSMLQYVVEHPKFKSWIGTFERSVDRGLIHHVDDIALAPEHQRQEIGARVHGRQVYWGIKHGVARMRLEAARVDETWVDENGVQRTKQTKNGYVTWPIYGYNVRIPDRIRAELPESLKTSETLQDLLLDPDGQDWWQAKGRTITLTFDLADGSWSRLIWADYWGRKPRTKIDP